MTRKLLTPVILLLSVVTSLALTTLPASAKTFQVKHGSNVAVASLEGREVTLCDGEDDGNAVQVQYARASGQEGAFWEKRGAGACATSGSGTVIVRMKVCEQRTGADSCTGWVTNPNLRGAAPRVTAQELRAEAAAPAGGIAIRPAALAAPAGCKVNDNLGATADDYISRCRKAVVRGEFPSEYLDLTLAVIKVDRTTTGRKAWKLLTDSRWAKP
ncbi:hypothetical protein GWI34_03865 [Actinomadura sp. DSM 109109]|nr:hypothetical protein [Actinomadura lepetitiana]